MILMGLAFGIIFPLGMVLGVCSWLSRIIPEVLHTNKLDYPLPLACPPPSRRNDHRRPGLLSRTRSQRSSIRQECPRPVREHLNAPTYRASRAGHLPEATSVEGNPRPDPSVYCHPARYTRKSDARCQLGSNALWWNHCDGLLPG